MLFHRLPKVGDTMRGTFRDDNFPEYEYVVIDEDDHYLQYKDGEIIAEGTVTSVDEIIYVEADDRIICAVYLDYKMYVFIDDEVRVFEKISDTPIYVNIDSEN